MVFYFHGAPTSRFDLMAIEDRFIELGVRVVSADRPGYGGSSPSPRRRLKDWPSDVGALADEVGARRFAVMGLSSGGPYAVACAALLGGRLVGAGVVAGVTDMGWPGARDDYDESEAALMRIGDESAATAWCEDRYGADGSRFFGSVGDLASADLALMSDETMAGAFMTAVIEAFRQGVGGFAQDITVQGRPWSFDPGAIATPVNVLHGEADTLVPISHGRHTAELIPTAKLTTWPDHGHLSMIAEIPRLAADLVAPMR